MSHVGPVVDRGYGVGYRAPMGFHDSLVVLWVLCLGRHVQDVGCCPIQGASWWQLDLRRLSIVTVANDASQ